MIKHYEYINLDTTAFSFDKKRVVIWGRSSEALRRIVYLIDRGAEIVGVMDSQSIQQAMDKGGRFAGIPYVNIAYLKSNPDVVLYITTRGTTSRQEIFELLNTFSILNTIVCFGMVYGPGEYDVRSMNELIGEDEAAISYVRACLTDERSHLVFNNLLEYRTSNRWELLKEIYEVDHPQYFAPDIVRCSESEVFIDAGGYNGDTSLEFIKYVNNKYNSIYIMEADHTMCEITKENMRMNGVKNVLIYEKGAYSNSGVLRFRTDSRSGSSHINKDGDVEIEVVSIDEMLDGKPATFIKMDIEGAERQALDGAKNTIRRYHPKLAISIYHLADDLWRIPYEIATEYPWYKLYMRHYTQITTETVLYAV